MIDWLTFHAPVNLSDRCGGYQTVTTADGEIVYQSARFCCSRGSYDSSVQYRIQDGRLTVSGNPAKYFQGHNLFGSDNVGSLALSLLDRLDLSAAVRREDITFSRIDFTKNYTLGSIDEVREVIRILGSSINRRWSGRGRFSGDTLYLGSVSRLQTKIYCKGDEIKKHTISENHPYFWQLINYAEKLLRIEKTIGRKLLNEVSNMNNIDNIQVFIENICMRDDLENITVSVPQKDDLSLNLPKLVVSSYLLWREGHDLRSLLQTRTFYRHRAELLKYGVDISIKQQSSFKPSLVPRIVDLVPDSVPAWALNTVCYYERNRDIAIAV